MSIQCPSCGSTQIMSRHLGRKVAATAGGVAGTASGVAGAASGAKAGAAVGFVGGPLASP
ncbi:hypothetical protein [Nitrincola sp. A-D6]|uniref:hypothetical protein n=1 Tax=Nitrincola sp. A-D6 TaxID=1545442 RepID=UPI001F30D3AC|nr:hypothetical protein [Nitrincola sp. A-D6]